MTVSHETRGSQDVAVPRMTTAAGAVFLAEHFWGATNDELKVMLATRHGRLQLRAALIATGHKPTVGNGDLRDRDSHSKHEHVRGQA